MKPELNVHFEGTAPAELVIRQGNALPPHEPKPMELHGRFGAPAEFLNKRPDIKSKENRVLSHVIFDYGKLSITLIVDEMSRAPITVEGHLIKHPFLDALKINGGAHSNKSLLNIVKNKGHFFKHMTEYRELVVALQKWETTVTNNSKDVNERKGFREQGISMFAETKITDKEYTVVVPFFEGHDAAEISFRVAIDTNDSGQVLIFLESPTFDEFWETAVDVQFKMQRPNFEAFAIIER